MQLYSPALPEKYSHRKGSQHFGIGWELRGLQHRPLWNLYWLSEPKLDLLLTQGVVPSRLDMGLVRACGVALDQHVGGQPLRQLAVTLDARTLAHLIDKDYAHLEPYVLYGPSWLATVKARSAVAASEAVSPVKRGVTRVEGSVLYVQFGRAGSKDLSVGRRVR